MSYLALLKNQLVIKKKQLTIKKYIVSLQASWLGASMFDLIHPEDGVKLREHLAVGLPNPSPASSHMFISPSQTGGASGTSGQSAGGGGGSCIGRVLDLKSGTVKKESTQGIYVFKIF